jgi:hypothetical protein
MMDRAVGNDWRDRKAIDNAYRSDRNKVFQLCYGHAYNARRREHITAEGLEKLKRRLPGLNGGQPRP